MATPTDRTQNGTETQLGINHLGHFVLIDPLVPLIVNDRGCLLVVASESHRSAPFALDGLHFGRDSHDAKVAYSRSKTANAPFAMECDRGHQARGVRSGVHLGARELSRAFSPCCASR